MERTHQLPSCKLAPAKLLGNPPSARALRTARSREPATSVRVVRRNDNMDTVGAAQTLLRATAQAAADAVLQPPSSSSAAPSEVSTATVRRVVGRARRGHALNIFQAFEVGFLGVILVTAEKYQNLAIAATVAGAWTEFQPIYYE